ncbi:MAG: DUF2807 domain-containing protein [Proteobacteria bacterium]|nr:DUF2807 domain-containing protein [Pseudomonadota bacterium]
MRTRIAILLFALVGSAALPAAAQKPDEPASAAGRTYTPGDFDTIDISGAAIVRFTQGTSDRVFVQGDDDAQRAVELEVRGRRLQIRPGGSWKFWNSGRLRIDVTARDLTRVGIYGAADFRADGPLQVDRLTVNIAGAGNARFDHLRAGQLSFEVSGAGNGDVTGIAKSLDVRIAGHSEFRGENLMTERAKVAISGIGDVKVWATDNLDVAVAGVGKVDYWGTPSLKRSVSGQATINDRGAKRPVQ